MIKPSGTIEGVMFEENLGGGKGDDVGVEGNMGEDSLSRW